MRNDEILFVLQRSSTSRCSSAIDDAIKSISMMISPSGINWNILTDASSTPPPTEINYPAGPLPPYFSWMPLRSQLDLTHDSNQSCLQLRSEYVLRITDWSVESGKTQKRTERHHMCRGWKIDTQHLESEVWGWGGGFASSFAWGGQRQLRVWASGALWGC